MARNNALVQYLNRARVYEHLDPNLRRAIASSDPSNNTGFVKKISPFVGEDTDILVEKIKEIFQNPQGKVVPTTRQPKQKNAILKRLWASLKEIKVPQTSRALVGEGIGGNMMNFPVSEDRSSYRARTTVRKGGTLAPWIVFVAALVLILGLSFLDVSKIAANPSAAFAGIKDLFSFKVTLVPVLIVAILVASFLEALLRKEWLALDFWICPITVGALIYLDHSLGNLGESANIENAFRTGGLSIGAVGVSLALLIVAMVTNQSEARQGKLGWLDTTPLYVTSGFLILLSYLNWDKIPYPGFLPLWIPLTLFVLGIVREIFRTPFLSLLGVTLGVLAAFLHSTPLFLLGLVITLLITTTFSKVEWVITPRTAGAGFSVPILGVPMIPMDTFIMQLYAFGLTSIWLQGGNYVWFAIGG